VDGLTGRWVLLAPERSARPHTVAAAPPTVPDAVAGCPFCPGYEDLTPPEVGRAGGGEADTPGWRVRVVPNLYPAVGGPHAVAPATGAHEVVVLSPAHDRSFGQLDDDQAVEVVQMLRDRTRFHLDAGHAYVQVIINHGRAAGASIAHPHAQIVAIDFVPPAVTSALERYAAAGSDLVRDDLAEGIPIVERAGTAAWCPHAPAAPYEFRAAPIDDVGARFDLASDDDAADLAVVLRDGLARLLATLGDVPYNLVLHTAVGDAPFHWYVEVQPRLTIIAGFELGTGVFVNTLPPERAAAELRG
jgi:UDPglucose--hexose-1-phosphate uridylyltransferase